LSQMRPISAAANGAVAALGGQGGMGGGQIAPPMSLGERIIHWVVSVSSVGLVLSVLIHIMLMLSAFLVTVGVAGLGSRGSGGGDFNINLTSEGSLTGIMDSAPLDALAPSVMDKEVAELPTAGVAEGSGGMDSPGAGAGLGPIESGLGGAGGGDIGDGKGLGSGGSGSGGASFFGLEAKGSRFLYICDISGSMDWDEHGMANGKRLRTLKGELTSSIQALLEHMQFYVIFFSSGAVPINPDNTKWIMAKDTGKRWAVDRIGNLHAFGGTEPWGAFELAFQMKPAPDAIYFMTDGEFDPAVAIRIQAVNVGSRKIPIHCITLVERSGEEVMRKIASDSGGTYVHVPGTK
jgi:hypothetical protein